MTLLGCCRGTVVRAVVVVMMMMIAVVVVECDNVEKSRWGEDVEGGVEGGERRYKEREIISGPCCGGCLGDHLHLLQGGGSARY